MGEAMNKTKCERTACPNSLDYGLYNIMNNNSDKGRNYCISCGRKIVELNEGIPFAVYDKNNKLIRKSEYYPLTYEQYCEEQNHQTILNMDT
jgi:hypothetical protein